MFLVERRVLYVLVNHLIEDCTREKRAELLDVLDDDFYLARIAFDYGDMKDLREHAKKKLFLQFPDLIEIFFGTLAY